MVFHERLWQLNAFLVGGESKADLGQSYLQLARVSYLLDNWDSINLERQLERARAALKLTQDALARETLSGLAFYLQGNVKA